MLIVIKKKSGWRLICIQSIARGQLKRVSSKHDWKEVLLEFSHRISRNYNLLRCCLSWRQKYVTCRVVSTVHASNRLLLLQLRCIQLSHISTWFPFDRRHCPLDVFANFIDCSGYRHRLSLFDCSSNWSKSERMKVTIVIITFNR